MRKEREVREIEILTRKVKEMKKCISLYKSSIIGINLRIKNYEDRLMEIKERQGELGI